MKKNINKKKLSTAIVGLGSIGLGYKNDNIILSHSQSITNHKKFTLVAGIDLKAKNRNLFIKKFKKPAFKRLTDIKDYNIDVVIVSTPDTQHLKIVLQVIKNFKVRLILIEKPCGTNYLETKEIFNFCKSKKIKILVNYQRNYNKKFNKIIKILKNQKLKGFFWYSRGIRNNCSHFINFLLRINNEKFNLKLTEPSKVGNFVLYNNKINISFLKTIAPKNIINECDLITNNFRITSKNDFNDFNIYKKNKSDYFKNYYEYSKKNKTIFTNFEKTQLQSLENIYSILKKDVKLNYNNIDIKTSFLLDKIQKILKK